ncbi:MAG: enoyl-ACP reductase FabV [Eubacteriales bacterium]
MVIKPKTKGFICTTAHPEGCAANVAEWIKHCKGQPKVSPYKNVLVIGSSAGYGLATRIACAYMGDASTLGVSFDRNAQGERTATPGMYNTAAFHKFAKSDGLWAKSVVGDAFSAGVKKAVCDIIRAELMPIDLLVYSLAAPSRIDRDGVKHSSVLKPLGDAYSSNSVDIQSGKLTSVTINPATEEEAAATVKVMGGEDWCDWMELLRSEGLLADKADTIAYSYIGPSMTHAIYKDGTIGRAKIHLKSTADVMSREIPGVRAFVSVNKAVVTQASSAIPVVPLYISILFDVMKQKGTHEDCVAQASRMLEKMGKGSFTDAEGYIRMDDLEMEQSVQDEVTRRWSQINEENISQLADTESYKSDFLRLFGFEVDGVDYEADINPNADEDGIIFA